MAIRVLAFMAHPDDVEFTCAGTLARLQQEAGCELVIATATSGDCGTLDHRPDDIARIRNAEARAAAGLLNAEYYSGRSLDLLVMYDEPTLRRSVEIVRRARPDIIITHYPSDYMIDHENVSRLVRTAAFAAPAPNLLTHDEDPAPRTDRVAHLYYADPVEGKDLFGEPVPPGFVIDVTNVMPLKEKMLACHASQREWLRAHHGMDEYLEAMKRAGAARGKLINRPYGEGFRQHLGHAYPQDNIIARLLGSPTAV
jgi:N-acetylglucosamine malate deacetylase 1